jgi:hypothetical protein
MLRPMKKRSVIAAIAMAAVLVLSLAVFAGANVQPKLSLDLTRSHKYPHKVLANGKYRPQTDSSKCLRRFRTVSVFLHKKHHHHGFVKITSTGLKGKYFAQFGHLSNGTWVGRATVQGDMSGPYGGNKICNDVTVKSSNSVTIG